MNAGQKSQWPAIWTVGSGSIFSVQIVYSLRCHEIGSWVFEPSVGGFKVQQPCIQAAPPHPLQLGFERTVGVDLVKTRSTLSAFVSGKTQLEFSFRLCRHSAEHNVLHCVPLPSSSDCLRGRSQRGKVDLDDSRVWRGLAWSHWGTRVHTPSLILHSQHEATI